MIWIVDEDFGAYQFSASLWFSYTTDAFSWTATEFDLFLQPIIADGKWGEGPPIQPDSSLSLCPMATPNYHSLRLPLLNSSLEYMGPWLLEKKTAFLTITTLY